MKILFIIIGILIFQNTFSQCTIYGPITSQMVCDNQLPYTWETQLCQKAGTYTIKKSSVNGCDSIITLLLTIRNEWTGAVDNQWNNYLNWSCASIPNKFSNVIINSGNVLLSSDAVINSLNIHSSATLTIDAGINLNILDMYSGCIEKYIAPPVSSHNIPASDTAIVNEVFELNSIDHSNLRYLNYIHDSVVLEFKGRPHDRKTIKFDRYSNGLRNLNGLAIYEFIDNIRKCVGSIYCYPFLTHPVSSDTIPNLSAEQIRKLFIANTEQFEAPTNTYKDSCFTAEFGYFTLNGFWGNPSAESIKAWKINSRNNGFPLAYYKDSDGSLIYYYDINQLIR